MSGLGSGAAPHSRQDGCMWRPKANSALRALAPRQRAPVRLHRAAIKHRDMFGRQSGALWIVRSAPAGGGGSGSGGGGGDGGGDGSEGKGDDSGGPAGLAANVWVLVLAAATALGLFKVGSQKLRLREQSRRLAVPEWQGVDLEQGIEWLKERKEWLQSKAWPQGSSATQQEASLPAASASKPASTDDIDTLTRLTQEAFAELVKVKQRLDALEEDAGLAAGGAAPAEASTTAVGGSRSRPASGGTGRAGPAGAHQHGRQRLAGVVRLGGGLMWAEEGEDAAAATVLQAAGLKLGTDALFQLSGLVRGGRDSVHAECRIDTAAQQASLRKILYSCRLLPRLRVTLAPFGARARDAAYTLNPLAGQGLTSLIRNGSPLHKPVLGSLVGLGLETSRAWLSAGYFARASPEGAAACSLLAQAVVAPLNTLSVGATFLEHRAEASGLGAAPATSNGAGSPSGAAAGPSVIGELERFVPRFVARSSGGLDQQVGTTLAWKLGDGSVLHGWASAGGERLASQLRERRIADVRPDEWGMVLGSYPDGSGSGWMCGIGRSAAGGAADLAPNMVELSLQHNLGDGLLVTPGLVVVKQRSGDHVAFLGAKSAWTF